MKPNQSHVRKWSFAHTAPGLEAGHWKDENYGVSLGSSVNMVGLLMTGIHIEITYIFPFSPLHTAFLLMCENEATAENVIHMFWCIYTSMLLRISKSPNSTFSGAFKKKKKPNQEQDNYRLCKNKQSPKEVCLM